MFSTPRPEPGHLLPALGSGLVVLLALPVFLVGGWGLGGWALAAVLWAAVHAIDALLLRARSTKASAAGSPAAIPKAGGSTTVTERSRSAHRAAANSETTAPYEWPTRCVAGSTNRSSQTASSSKSTRSTSGPGGKPRRFGTTSSKRSASGRCAPQGASRLTTLPWTSRRRGRDSDRVTK